MTKVELLEALQPFTDETEIMIGDRDRWFEVDSHFSYKQRFDGYGCLVLNLGARILLRAGKRPAAHPEMDPDAYIATLDNGREWPQSKDD